MSNLLELETQVKQIYKRDDTGTLQPKTAINDTYKAMLAIIGHHKLQDRAYKDIIADQYEISLPSSLLRIHHPIKLIDPEGSADSVNSGSLRFVSKQEYDAMEPEADDDEPSSGTPRAYTLWKNAIYLTPPPDKAYTLEMNIGGEPVDLLVDADESILSSVWDETIKAGALHRLYAAVKLYDDSEYWRKVYLNGSEGDGYLVVGGLNLLRQLEGENTKAPLIVENQPL
jgi:hypothetical protein